MLCCQWMVLKSLVIDLIGQLNCHVIACKARRLLCYCTTLRQLITNVKDKDEPNDRQGAVYKIKCCDCHAGHLHW